MIGENGLGKNDLELMMTALMLKTNTSRFTIDANLMTRVMVGYQVQAFYNLNTMEYTIEIVRRSGDGARAEM